MPIRFHLDENVDHAVGVGLRRRGIDVTTASDSQLIGGSDLDHVEFALREGRVIVTHDADFLRIAHKGPAHAGIAFCRARDWSIGEMFWPWLPSGATARRRKCRIMSSFFRMRASAEGSRSIRAAPFPSPG